MNTNNNNCQACIQCNNKQCSNTNKPNLKFSKVNNNDKFYSTLKRVVNNYTTPSAIKKAQQKLWLKFIVYTSLFVGAYLHLIFNTNATYSSILVNYIVIGLSGILLAFNTAHDAAHNTFSTSKWINAIVYNFSFNLQGVNAYLWQIRHKSSHHIFANVDGSDADIDDNPFLRLSPTHKVQSWHKYQHIYAPILYTLYTLHWIFIKDINYLFKKQLANLKFKAHPWYQYLLFVVYKVLYIYLLIILPSQLLGIGLSKILLAFALMHVFISIFFVYTLIISHLNMATTFPQANKYGKLPTNYYWHQLSVSLDYHPQSRIVNYILGGFNAHAAHHLFPNLPHTLYRQISKIIPMVARHFNYPYNAMSIPKAIYSHYLYLKKLSVA
jgi:linoleoyl-CoA desaturase